MRHHALLPLAAALANLVICVPVLRRGVRQPVIRTFAFMTAATVSWNLAIFSLYYFQDAAQAEWWNRVFRTGICFAPVTAFHFAIVIAGTEGRWWRTVLGAGYATSALLALANMQGALVSGLTPHVWGWYPQPTRLYTVLSALIVVYLPLTVERMWYALRHAPSSRQRVQAKFTFLAAMVQIPFVSTNILALRWPERIYPIGDLGNVLYVGIIAYAIVRHRLMDVDYVVRKIVSFAAAGFVILAPGGFGIWALNVALGSERPLVLTSAALALALVAVVLIPTLQAALETRVHRALFPNLYDYRLRLRQLGAALVHILDQGQLVQRLGDALTDILDVESCHVVVRDEFTRRMTTAYPAPGDVPEALPEELTHALDGLAEPVLASELEFAHPSVAAVFRARGWEVAIPLRINDRLTGLVALGRHRELRIFSSEDLQLLGTVAAGASVALENASLSRQLRRSEIVLERANQLSSLGMLAAGIAHEIRNPLVAVKTFLDLLPQRLDDREFLDHFRELSLGELRRVTDLITDMLALGKSKTAVRGEVHIPTVLEPVVRLMESTARKRQVELLVRMEPALPAVWADGDQLKQITLNLLLNAIEVSPAGKQVRLEVRRAGRDGIVLEVSDQGPGIPADQREAIFHPFYTTKDFGTGLGLALVHQMVVEHGGEIVVDSASGRGTAFRVTLPVAQLDLERTGT
jgi:signal transduction histidine kinase